MNHLFVVFGEAFGSPGPRPSTSLTRLMSKFCTSGAQTKTRMISRRNTMEHSGASGCSAPAHAGRRGPVPPARRARITGLLLMAALCGAPLDASAEPSVAAIQWLPSRGPECVKRGRYKRFCQGPRRVPAPSGEAAELARKLGLGERKSAALLLIGAPPAAWIEAAGAVEAASTWQRPIADGRLLRGMGRSKKAAARRAGATRRRVRYHEGLDIGAPEGSAIAAAQSGIVVYSDNGVRGYGNLVVVVHADGSAAFYAHCRATYVFPGQHVTRGQVIAEVGHTGYARGAHLHFEYRINGVPTDPTPWFE